MGSRKGKGGRSSVAGPPAGDETRVAVRCKVCRRWLVDPESVVLGLGPTCRGER